MFYLSYSGWYINADLPKKNDLDLNPVYPLTDRQSMHTEAKLELSKA